MQVARRESNGGFTALTRQFNRLLEDFFDTSPGFETAAQPGTLGFAVDIAETPETYVLKAELPGIDPKTIEISMAENVLTVKAERREEKEEKGKTWHRVERSYGQFSRSIRLPAPILADRVEAESKEGVLTITVPKGKEAITRRIEVKGK